MQHRRVVVPGVELGGGPVSVRTQNAYLADNFAPVQVETTAFDLPVTGTVPEHLDGRYLRNGPNPVAPVDPAHHHWFLGSGMVHGLRLREGKAQWYRNRFVRSADVATALGEPRRAGAGVHGGWDFPANTNVVVQAGRTFAIVEAGPLPYELTDELETKGSCDFAGTLPGGWAAHPKRDPLTGELHAVSYFWGWGNKVRYTVLGTDARIRRSVDIEVTGSPMMHDFALTQHHIVLFDLPCVFDPGAVAGLLPRQVRDRLGPLVARAAGLATRRRPTPAPISRAIMSRLASAADPVFPYVWDPDYPARVGVLPREGSAADVTWYDVDPCYVFHPLNAYEDGDRIVVDVVRHPRMFDTQRLGPAEGRPTLDRWTIDRPAGKVRQERLDERGQEFPRIDERLLGRRHRYGYAVGFDAVTGESLIRHDLAAGGTALVRDFGAGHNVGEFVHVPDSPDAPEDAGTLMGFVHDPNRGAADLMLLDAATLETKAAVHLPVRVPAGFHGNWAPA